MTSADGRRRRLARAVVALVACVVVSLGATSRASADGESPAPTARERARDAFDRAERAVAGRRYAEAVAAYDAALAADPSAPFATVARARVADLRAHDEGAFAPLARLDEVRRDPERSKDRAAIEALARDLEAFPAGRVRGEARLVVAEALWHALGDPRRAATELGAVLDDRSADRLIQALALTELVAIERELGDLGAARDAARAHRDLAPRLAADLDRLARRGALRRAASALVALLALAGAASFVRASLRARDPRAVAHSVVRPLAVAFSLYLGGAAALIVHLRGGEDPRPFLLLGLGVLALDVIARAWRLAARDERWLARGVRATSCAAGVVAVAFLILDRTATGVLDALGL
jgi:hypothetical protein